MEQAISGCGVHRGVCVCKLADKLSNLHRSSECSWVRQGGRLSIQGKALI